MILNSVRVGVFGSLRDLRVDLAPGLNVVLAPNEAGKSTLFAAIRHAILTPARLTPSQATRLVGRYFPRPAGNAIEVELSVEAGGGTSPEGEYRIRKRWGEGSAAVLVTPDGAELSGAEGEERLGSLLPVRPGTFLRVFLVDQAELDRTLDQLAAEPQSRDEIASLLRRARTETGGVSVEAFQRALETRLKSVFGRWDRERNRPEGGRGIERPWEKGRGRMVDAYYELQRSERELQDTVEAEEELEAATSRLDELATTLRRTEEFLATHAEARDALRQVDRVERELATQNALLAELRAAVRRWPVVEAELGRNEAELARAKADAAAAAAELAGLEQARARSSRRAHYERATAARAEAEAAVRARDSLPAVSEEQLSELRAAESAVVERRARLEAGSLRARIATSDALTVTTELDDDAPTELALSAGDASQIEAHRRIRFEVQGLVIEVEAGDESFTELRERLSDAEETRIRCAERAGVATAAEGTELRARRAAAEQEVARAQRRFQEALGTTPYEALRDEFEGDDDLTSAGGPPGATASVPDVAGVAAVAADARERVGSAQSARTALEQELRALVERFGGQDQLEDLLAETRTTIAALERERTGAGSVPEGFSSVESFLAAYREQESHISGLRSEHQEARVRQAELLGRLPERTAEEAMKRVADARADYEQVRREAHALERLEQVTGRVIAEQQSDPFETFAARVSAYLDLASQQTYTLRGGDDPLIPSRYARRDGPELDYELLSQGTRDMVALAIRLALAESAAGDESAGAPSSAGTSSAGDGPSGASGSTAPLLLDDPLVDMDPERRRHAAEAISRYAAGRQVVLFTCHPDHAALFGEANRVTLERPGVSAR